MLVEALAVARRRRSKRAIDPYTVYGKGEYGDAEMETTAGWLVRMGRGAYILEIDRPRRGVRGNLSEVR